MKLIMGASVGLGLLVAGIVSAQEAKTKEEAQAQVDAGMAKSCEMARSQTLAKKDLCPEEARKLEPVDCTKRESRKSVDFLAVNSACQAKVRQSAGKSGNATSSAPEKAEGAEKAKPKPSAEVSCRATDESGKVVVQAEMKRNALSCRAALRQAVTKDHCETGKVMRLKFISTNDGKDSEPESFRVTCK